MTDSPLPFPETALFNFVRRALHDIENRKDTPTTTATITTSKNNELEPKHVLGDNPVPVPAPDSDPTTTAAAPCMTHFDGIRTPFQLTRHTSIEGDDHMIFSIDTHPEYILRVTKPRANRGSSGLAMQTRENAVLAFFRSEYQRRGLAASILPECVASCPDLCVGSSAAGVVNGGGMGRTGETPGTYAAALCTRLHGRTLDEVEPTGRTLEDLTVLMGIMKSVDDVQGFEKKLGVKMPRIEFPSLVDLRREAMNAWRKMISDGDFDVDKKLLDTVSSTSSTSSSSADQSPCDPEGFFERKTAFINEMRNHLLEEGWSTDPSKLVFVHNDIKGEHILVDKSTGSITGLLDWSDAGFGHPATDIYGLVLTVGRNAAERISRTVGYDEETILQGVLLALCSCVLNLDGRLRGVAFLEAPVHLLKQQLRTSLRD